ncbi:MAG: hypothetical protein WCV86_00560 [Patescibacteria group bacterium]|jgi:hypothetical protein
MKVEILETHGSIGEDTFEIILTVGQYLVFTRQAGHQMRKGYAEDEKHRRVYLPQDVFDTAIRAANIALNAEREKSQTPPEPAKALPPAQLGLF